MDFSWSTPLRRNGQTTLSIIPSEIYLIIFECIAPTNQLLPEQHVKTFSALALVCRFFCSVALPRVFESVIFSGNTSGNRAQASRQTALARQIVANTEPAKSIALYVKECYFRDWVPLKEAQWFLFSFTTLYCQAMAHMSNIRKVEFFRSFVKKEHWKAMGELKQLESLEFRLCSFIENPPNQELSVRTLKMLTSTMPFILRPIATSTLRTLETTDLEGAVKLVTFRPLAIENLVLHRVFEMELLLQVFQLLPGLKSVTFGITRQVAASPLISALSLKKLFTRLRSLTVQGCQGHTIRRQDTETLVGAICEGPGTLPSLEKLDFSFPTDGGQTATVDIISDRLKGTILPAFPNVRCIHAPHGSIRLEEGNWKRYHLGVGGELVVQDTL